MLVCRGRNEGSDLLCLMSKWLMAVKSESVAGLVLHVQLTRCGSQSVLQGQTVGLLQDSRCRDLGCFGRERAEFTVPVHVYLLLAMLSFSHPFGLPPVRKALWVTTLSHNTTDVFGFFTFFPQLKLGEENKLYPIYILKLQNLSWKPLTPE